MGEAELYAGRRREADDVTNLNQINSQRQLLRVFGGLNEGYACSEAELSEEKNFSSRGYPALETRKPRRKVTLALSTTTPSDSSRAPTLCASASASVIPAGRSSAQ